MSPPSVRGATPRGATATGVVTAFDADEGLGTVRLDGGGEAGFHATQISDGSRRIEVGAAVEVRVVPWHRGRLEAAEVARRGREVPPAGPDC